MLQYLKNNLKYILLAFSLISSAIVVIPFREYIYYMGLIYLFYYSLRNFKQKISYGTCFLFFLLSCYISSLIALIFDYRLFAFTGIIISCTSITMSKKLFIFRKRYLFNCLMTFPFLSIASLLCYYLGINYFTFADGSKGSILDFSGFFPHPMWLGAATGLSNIVLIWLIFTTQKIALKIVYTLILLLSIYMSIIAASRSAFFASLLSMVFFLILKLRDIKKIIILGSIISILTIITIPIYLSGAERMQDKFENAEGKYGSRTGIVTIGIKHFKENPLFGTGFAVSYNSENEKVIGRMESGSGWLSILFQTGIIGFTIVIISVSKIYKVIKYTKYDNKLLLFINSFLFLCLHSIFEGYILTIGYYLCILFWTLLGYLYSYQHYKKIALIA
jgi:hypothetical protein